MKPFKFRLEKVLEYRRQLEEQAKMELAKALRERDLLCARVKDLEARFEELTERMAEAVSMTSAELWLWRTYKERLATELEEARFAVARIEIEVARCRKHAVERAKERKLLEKLKSTQAVKYVREQNLREQKEFDEMATIRYQPQAV
ncbi:MAG: flagellar export protein FliJ [Desulfovibrionaceae bacterium]|nr:flagellar export protein FliJ [Desulfovibrionaceae bacterium]MBF0512447.1 flagellar export protein FliJ [Desulfovibrionaceae bacterium]